MPCIVAGLRANSVGTDVAAYGEAIYYQAKQTDLATYWQLNSSFAPLFQIYSWASANLSPSISLFLAFLQFPSILFAALSCRIVLRSRAYEGLMIYMLVFYPMSLNMMRQSISISLVLLAVCLLSKRKPLESIFVLMASVGFHYSALIGVIPLGVTWVWLRRDRLAFSLVVLGSVICILSVILYPFLVEILKVFAGSYAWYLDEGGATQFGAAIFTSGMFLLLVFYFGLPAWKRFTWDCLKDAQSLYLAICFFGAVLYLFALRAEYLYRISLYCLIVSVLLPMGFSKQASQGRTTIIQYKTTLFPKRREIIINIRFMFTSIWSLVFFVTIFCILQMHEVIPYVFR